MTLPFKCLIQKATGVCKRFPWAVRAFGRVDIGTSEAFEIPFSGPRATRVRDSVPVRLACQAAWINNWIVTTTRAVQREQLRALFAFTWVSSMC